MPGVEKSRCLFCASTTAKRSREHVLRRAFKRKIDPADALSFSHLSGSGTQLSERPISQFDMTVNDVCRECNQGWLNDLENQVEPIIDGLLADYSSLQRVGPDRVEMLGYWAFIRALLRTYVSPQGRAPQKLLQHTYEARKVLPGCYVQIAASTEYVWEAGSHQSLRIALGGSKHYLGYVAFGLGGLLFLVSLSDSSNEASRRAFDVIRQPRLWFPGSFCWLAPPESPSFPMHLLSGAQAQMAGLSLALRAGVIQPLDQFSNKLDPSRVIPARFLPNLQWEDCDTEPGVPNL